MRVAIRDDVAPGAHTHRVHRPVVAALALVPRTHLEPRRAVALGRRPAGVLRHLERLAERHPRAAAGRIDGAAAAAVERAHRGRPRLRHAPAQRLQLGAGPSGLRAGAAQADATGDEDAAELGCGCGCQFISRGAARTRTEQNRVLHKHDLGHVPADEPDYAEDVAFGELLRTIILLDERRAKLKDRVNKIVGHASSLGPTRDS